MLKVEGLSKSFSYKSGTLKVLDDISFYVDLGEFVSIVGPSGCGKSTLLHVIAGLDQADCGSIEISGNSSASRLGHVGYMQQRDLLLPWRTVLDNVILGLEIQGTPKTQARHQAIKHIEAFGLNGFEKQYPFTLSGGMRQRAAFLRSVLLRQELMLLDEPFGALDALTRHHMQEWLINMWRTLSNTVILVTHDIDEALMLSDKIYLLSARPAKIAMSLVVDLPRPRTHTTITDPEFTKLKSSLLAKLHDTKFKIV